MQESWREGWEGGGREMGGRWEEQGNEGDGGEEEGRWGEMGGDGEEV